jgi:hypothetical protein
MRDDLPCPFCGGTGFRKEPGCLMERCSWCQQPPLGNAAAAIVLNDRQARIEKLLA